MVPTSKKKKNQISCTRKTKANKNEHKNENMKKNSVINYIYIRDVRM